MLELTGERWLIGRLRGDRGFTLIELMIVVLIIGVIAAIGYPNYTQYVQESRRTDARAALMDAAQRMQRCYSDSLAYDAGSCTTVATDIAGDSEEGYYSITVPGSDLGADTYTLTATAQGTQLNDEPCRSLSVDESGDRSAKSAGGSDNTDECW